MTKREREQRDYIRDIQARNKREAALPLTGARLKAATPVPSEVEHPVIARSFKSLIDAARARTIATPLATHRTHTTRALQAALESGDFRAPLTCEKYACVRHNRDGVEVIDVRSLSASREGAENHMAERMRLDAVAIRKGTVQPYLRVIKIRMEEIEEDAS